MNPSQPTPVLTNTQKWNLCSFSSQDYHATGNPTPYFNVFYFVNNSRTAIYKTKCHDIVANEADRNNGIDIVIQNVSRHSIYKRIPVFEAFFNSICQLYNLPEEDWVIFSKVDNPSNRLLRVQAGKWWCGSRFKRLLLLKLLRMCYNYKEPLTDFSEESRIQYILNCIENFANEAMMNSWRGIKIKHPQNQTVFENLNDVIYIVLNAYKVNDNVGFHDFLSNIRSLTAYLKQIK